jgi:hypothetical protein
LLIGGGSKEGRWVVGSFHSARLFIAKGARWIHVQRLTYEVQLSLLVISGYLILSLGIFDRANALAAGDVQFLTGACKVLSLPEGSWGALVASIAGVVAIISAAMGMYRSAINLIIVSVACVLIRPLMGMFFNVECPSFGPTKPSDMIVDPPSGGGGENNGGSFA